MFCVAIVIEWKNHIKTLNKNELSLISGTQKIMDLMGKRRLTNVFPNTRPHGIRLSGNKGFHDDCACEQSNDCHCNCAGDCPDCSSDCNDVNGNDCGDCGGGW